MYAVVYKNRVLTGPMDWNRGIFQGALSKQGVTQTLPRVAPAEMPYVVNEDATIFTVVENRPTMNPMVEYYYGPLWDITPTEVIANYDVVDSPLDAAKMNFVAYAAEERWKRETAGVNHTLQGQTVWIDTSREGRAIFMQALTLMNDTQTMNWKFPQGWFVMSKTDLADVVSAGASYVESCFNWEKSIDDQIQAATTKQELLDIQILPVEDTITDPTVETQ